MVKTKLPKLNPWAFSGAVMITWFIYIVLLGITSAFGWGTQLMNSLSSIYVGYDVTLLGILIGGLWAAVDAFVFGLLIALIYNWTLNWCPMIKK